jgi:Tol biopolymer transport system component
MRVAAGTRFGAYEIVAPLGAGGMGEVYRARDTRLGREVAVKLLSEQLADHPTALARFEREARAVAALNHPNILALFDIGNADSSVFAVTELLEGQTLRDRLRAGPLPLRTTLEYARAIADALAAAHDRGIVHRDIKPENIFLTTDGRVKVLDFGLAQIAEDAVPASATGDETTVHTTPGVIVGTIGYMAPEQVRSQPSDARTDIFTFGLVLYEMLTGVRAFRANTPADTMSAILNVDPPDFSVSGASVPPSVDRLVRRCLEKSPAQRFQSARDLSFALEAVSAGASSGVTAAVPARRRPRWLAPALGLLLLAGVGAAGVLFGRRTATTTIASPVGRFVLPASQTTGPPMVSVSPDGAYVVYISPATGRAGAQAGSMWLRRLDGAEPQLIDSANPTSPLARAASFVFFSPDSRRLAFFSGNDLFALVLPDGSPQRLAELPSLPRYGAWGARNVIVVSSTDGKLYRVEPDTGNVRLIVTLDPSSNGALGLPTFLPDGERFLYTVIAGHQEVQSSEETRVASIDGQSMGTAFKGGVGTFYAGGHLVFGSNGALYAQRFDTGSLKVEGSAVEIAPAVMQDLRNAVVYASASSNGVLVYRLPTSADVRFTWMDRSGRQLSSVNVSDAFTNFGVSPDGTRIMATRRHPITNTNQLWLVDVARNVATLAVPNGEGGYSDPVWMPDGQHVIFRYQQQLVMRLANGGDRRVLLNAQGYPDSVTQDGRYVLYGIPTGDRYELNALDITAQDVKPIPLVTGATVADEGKFSPNARWIAYHSNETGSLQIAVIPFPPTGERWQISQAGGVQPRWSKDGQELFYLDLQGQLMSVRMSDSDPRRAQAPVALFSTGLQPSSSLDQFEPVGDRFLVRLPVAGTADTSPVGVVVNWEQLVK